MSELQKMREKQQKLVADARLKLDEINDKTDDTRAVEIEKEYDAIMAEHDKIEARAVKQHRLDTADAALEKVITDLPVVEDRAAAGEGVVTRPEASEAFEQFLRTGMSELSNEQRSVLKELRAQAAGTDTAGGFTVPQGFQAEVIKTLQMFGPMLDPAVTRVLNTSSGNQIDWPTMDDTANKGALLAENVADTEQDLVFGSKSLDAYKYTSNIIRVSEELLQDSAVDVSGIVAAQMGERLGRIGNEHLTVGTGTGQPNGILTASSLGDTAGAAAAISLDDVINLIHSVDPAYRLDPSCAFQMNDATLKLLRKLKDLDGNYIWQPADARTGEPARLFDYSYIINQDMTGVAASTKSMIFGAMNRYVARMVTDLVVKRVTERYAEFYQVGFLGFARFDGELMDTSAVKHLVHPI